MPDNMIGVLACDNCRGGGGGGGGDPRDLLKAGGERGRHSLTTNNGAMSLILVNSTAAIYTSTQMLGPKQSRAD